MALAEHHDAKALRILGGRIFEVIAPDLAEKFDGKALEAEEAKALRRTTFTMWEDDEGTCHGRFRIPALHGQMLQKMILAISSPSRSTNDTASSGIDPDLPTPVRHGIALTQLIETYPAEKLPKTGGCSATVVVTITLEQLLADLDHAGRLHPGHRRTHHRSRSTTSRLHRRDHPGRPRRQEPAPRRRPQTPAAHRVDAPSHGGARRRLHRAGLRNTSRPLPRPPRQTVVRRRSDQRGHRSPPLPAPSQAGARPEVRDPTPAWRQGHLPPADLNTPGRYAEMSGASTPASSRQERGTRPASSWPRPWRPVSISSPFDGSCSAGTAEDHCAGQPVTARQWIGSGRRSNPP